MSRFGIWGRKEDKPLLCGGIGENSMNKNSRVRKMRRVSREHFSGGKGETRLGLDGQAFDNRKKGMNLPCKQWEPSVFLRKKVKIQPILKDAATKNKINDTTHIYKFINSQYILWF